MHELAHWTFTNVHPRRASGEFQCWGTYAGKYYDRDGVQGESGYSLEGQVLGGVLAWGYPLHNLTTRGSHGNLDMSSRVMWDKISLLGLKDEEENVTQILGA